MKNIEVTEVRIFKARNRKGVLAYANIVVNDCLKISGIKLVETEKSGRFISMPDRRIRVNGEKPIYRDMCHPLDIKTREELTNKIFESYEEFLTKEDTEE